MLCRGKANCSNVSHSKVGLKMEEALSLSVNRDAMQRTAQEIPSISRLGVLGVSFKTTSIAIREILLRNLKIQDLADLREEHPEFNQDEIVLLSTCNRIEIYYFQSERSSNLIEFLQALFFLDVNKERDFKTYHHIGISAVEHLFEVAAGLDSLVVGEAQILSQVKESLKLSQEKGLSGPVTSRLFSKAFGTGRKLREENPEFGQGLNRSVSLAVVEIVERYFETKKKLNLLLIGSGKMVKLAAGSISKQKTTKVVVASRKNNVDGIEADLSVKLADIGRVIAEQEIHAVIAATSSESYILGPKDLRQLSSSSSESKLLILDISVPRNVDPDVGRLPNVVLFNLDDLKDQIRPLDFEETAAFWKVKRQVGVKVGEFSSWLVQYFEIQPVMSALRRKADAIRYEEVQNAVSRMPELTSEERAVIEKMAERMIRRFLHKPDSNLKQLTREEGIQKAMEYSEAIRELFAIEIGGNEEGNSLDEGVEPLFSNDSSEEQRKDEVTSPKVNISR